MILHQKKGTYMNELHLHATRKHQHHSHFNNNNLAIVGGVSLLHSLMPFCGICCMCLRITDSLRLGSILWMHGRARGDTSILSIISWQMKGWSWCTERPGRGIHHISPWQCWHWTALFYCLITSSSDGLHITKTWRNMPVSGNSFKTWKPSLLMIRTSLRLSYLLVNIMTMTFWVCLHTAATYSTILVTVMFVAVGT